MIFSQVIHCTTNVAFTSLGFSFALIFSHDLRIKLKIGSVANEPLLSCKLDWYEDCFK
jgi:hypothetical protein